MLWLCTNFDGYTNQYPLATATRAIKSQRPLVGLVKRNNQQMTGVSNSCVYFIFYFLIIVVFLILLVCTVLGSTMRSKIIYINIIYSKIKLFI
jgi:hypothetical protein